ncbi:MAG: HD domain-containing protein [Brevefilum sp.]|nr:HD domain-containing protein [Brevefilum sp.]
MNEGLDFLTILDAVVFAAEKHQGQVRKNKHHSPYITHPLLVAKAIYEIGTIDETYILTAAILHDTLEDTRTTAQEIADRFGDRVLSIVLEVTDDKSEEKMDRKRNQVIHAPNLSYEGRIIKLADKLINFRDILNDPPEDWPLERRRDYVQWGADVVENIRGTNSLLEAAFDQVLSEAQGRLNFKILPFETVDERPWGPNSSGFS